MMTNDNKVTTNDDKINFTLRIREPVAAELTQASRKMGVSMNAYILMVLDEKLRKKDGSL